MLAVTYSPDDWGADRGVDVHDETFRYRLEQRFCSLAWELLALGLNVILEFGLWGRDAGTFQAPDAEELAQYDRP